MERVCIDGAMGEGGGQVLRTALTLSCITGRHLRIENIRAKRPKPGLAKQHLACVEAAVAVCGGKCKGAELGSRILDFQPGVIAGGDYDFNIGSAGSALLVIQTVLPVLFCADKRSTVTVTGGTHNPWAPPFDFVKETFLPAIASAGFKADCRLLRYGFFPAGGGKIAFEIQPGQSDEGRPIDLCDPLDPPRLLGKIYTAKLPPDIAMRQKKLLAASGLEFAQIERVNVTDSDGAGNCVVIRVCTFNRTTVFTSFGARGKPSEKVIEEAVEETGTFLESGAAVDSHLADQLLIYMALQKTGHFTTNEMSNHLTTNIDVIKSFLPVDFTVTSQGGVHRIECRLHDSPASPKTASQGGPGAKGLA